MHTDQITPIHACPGKTMRMQGATAPICYGCQRYGAHAEKSIEPRALLDPAGQSWSCPNRVSSFAYVAQEHS